MNPNLPDGQHRLSALALSNEFLNYGAIQIFLVDCDPEVAQECLKSNTNNRRLSDPDAARLARDMETKDWIFLGDPVRFGLNGELYDGQHRLRAIVLSDTTQTILVVTGLPPEAKPVIDTGRRRQYSQNLAMRGEANATLLASTLRSVAQWLDGTPVNSNFYPTPAELDSLLDEYPQVRLSVELASKVAGVVRCNPTSASLSHFICSIVDSHQANEFFSTLVTGAGLTLGAPALTLREKLIRNKSQDERLSGSEQAALMLIAWNAYRQSRTLSKLYLPKIGLSNETFPKAK